MEAALAEPQGNDAARLEGRNRRQDARGLRLARSSASTRPPAATSTRPRSACWSKSKGGNDELAKDVALHVAAMKPKATTKDELDKALVAKEREIQTEQARKEGKPETSSKR